MLVVTAPILINKDVFEPSYNDLKFTVQKCNYFCTNLIEFIIASLVAQTVKNLPAMQETQVPSLGLEDPLVKGMATHSSITAWRTPWTEEPDRLQPMGSQRVRHN